MEGLDARKIKMSRSYLKTLFRVWAAFLNPMAKAGEALSPFEGG